MPASAHRGQFPRHWWRSPWRMSFFVSVVRSPVSPIAREGSWLVLMTA